VEIIYRDGKKKDCLRLAELDNIASQGAVNYLFHDLVPGFTPVQVVAHGLEGDDHPHSYRSAIVAEYNNEVVGMALSYPSRFHGVTEEMKGFFPAERLEHFKHFFSARVEDSLFLDALGVLPEFRGKGIGTELIHLTEKKAVENGHTVVSLMVFADNTEARRLYERCGFAVVETVELLPHDLIPHEGGCLLMSCRIAV
jgi:ribosomal protein S18 acetylase RimI-like enzyme